MPILLASEVMDLTAAALNDANKTVYTYTVQIPYLKLALQELQEIFELNSLSVTEASSAVIPVNSGQTEIQFNVTSGPRLPDNLIEPKQLWERNRNSNPFIPMTKLEFIPHGLTGTQTNQFTYWVWQQNKIILLSSNADNDIKIDGIFSLFPKYVNQHTIIPVINAQNFLAWRTAGIIAEFVEKNESNATKCNGNASLSLDNIKGISIKGKQSIVTRRRPFRGAWNRRGWF